MAPKTTNAGTKRQTGGLTSWLTASQRDNSNRKRARSDSNTANDCAATTNKKTKPNPSPGRESTKVSDMPPPTATSNTELACSNKRTDNDKDKDNSTLSLSDHTGDIFSAPSNTLIIHACNCQGSWSAGIAAAFKKHFPSAFKVYAARCRSHDASSLLGTALLIPPASLTNEAATGSGAPRINGKIPQSKAKTKQEEQHLVGCLFTSNYYGKRRDSPAKILGATGPAMRDLLAQVKQWNASHGDGEKVGRVRICKINSGLFGVPWEETVEVLEGIEVAEDGETVKEVEVWERKV